MKNEKVIIEDACQDTHGVDGPIVVVADGHGPCGKAASGIAVSAIMDGAAGGNTDHDVIRKAFHAAHQQIIASDKDAQVRGGTTATLAIVRDGNVCVAWVGNSEARIVKRDGKLKTLAIPHEFGRHRGETSRLRQSGATIVSHRSATYYDERSDALPRYGRVQSGNVSLEVTRALGDPEFDPFVLHEPEIREFPISPDDRFLLVGSDGFWHPATRRTAKRHLLERQLAEAASLDDARARIASLLSRWKIDDDLTLIIVDLDT